MDLNKALLQGISNLQNAVDKGEEIVNGYTNFVLGNYEDIGKQRMDICKGCPLYKRVTNKVHVCNPTLEIEHVTEKVKVKGCSCVLEVKTVNPLSYCPAGKWHSIQIPLNDANDENA